jgi:hypothetical protein
VNDDEANRSDKSVAHDLNSLTSNLSERTVLSSENAIGSSTSFPKLRVSKVQLDDFYDEDSNNDSSHSDDGEANNYEINFNGNNQAEQIGPLKVMKSRSQLDSKNDYKYEKSSDSENESDEDDLDMPIYIRTSSTTGALYMSEGNQSFSVVGDETKDKPIISSHSQRLDISPTSHSIFAKVHQELQHLQEMSVPKQLS